MRRCLTYLLYLFRCDYDYDHDYAYVNDFEYIRKYIWTYDL